MCTGVGVSLMHPIVADSPDSFGMDRPNHRFPEAPNQFIEQPNWPRS
jgi:hypothetical protein